MAEHLLIDRYLEALRERVRWHSDPDEVIAEVEDHLRTAAERLEATGAEPRLAQHLALDRFGDPDLVARALSTTSRGGLALPTTSTRAAGNLAIAAATLWIALAVSWWVAGILPPWGELDRNASAVFYTIGWAALLLANALIVVVASALHQRHGGLGALGSVGTVLAALGLAASTAAWLIEGWGPIVLIATLVLAVAMLGPGLAPRLPLLALAVAFPLGALTLILLRVGGGTLGCCGVWGGDWVANSIGLTVAAVVVAFGLMGIGRWLRDEEPAPLELLEGSPVG